MNGGEFWSLRGQRVCLSCGVAGKAGMKAEVVFSWDWRGLGWPSGKVHQKLPACHGSRLSVVSRSQRGTEQLSEVGSLEVSVELGELEEFEGGG